MYKFEPYTIYSLYLVHLYNNINLNYYTKQYKLLFKDHISVEDQPWKMPKIPEIESKSMGT